MSHVVVVWTRDSYPGWRLGWVLGPKDVIATLERCASSVDGGPSRPSQALAKLALEPR